MGDSKGSEGWAREKMLGEKANNNPPKTCPGPIRITINRGKRKTKTNVGRDVQACCSADGEASMKSRLAFMGLS